MKVANLSGAALDWAVAKCEGIYFTVQGNGELKAVYREYYPHLWENYSPTTDWSQGGPIIEREGISILPLEDGGWTAATGELYVEDDNPRNPTPLIAAMRCYVASKLGDDVDIDVGVIQTHS